jgi:hypothetical protein
MALNPFFLQGSPNEQRLVQELINEQLRIYGVEVIYIPRKFVRRETILREVSSSKFDDNFALEAYVSNYEGYSGQGDILTKFGMSLKDDLSLIISKERYEDFIAPFLDGDNDEEIVLSSRPREGDLIYFPLGQRLFEVKFVEHEQPFYQLGKLYVYELKCELFEYEDEVIDTSIHEIDTQIEDEGYITTLTLIGLGRTATALSTIGTGYIREITLNNDGYGYTFPPVVSISSAPFGGTNAIAEAIAEINSGVYSIKGISLKNAGSGYTSVPTITITGNGTGAGATCSIETSQYGVISITLTDNGVGYSTAPQVTITGTGSGIGETATAISSVVGTGQTVSSIKITNPGIGYITAPQVVINGPPILTGIGTYVFNEIITGSMSGTTARVKFWDFDTKILKVSFVDNVTPNGFFPGETIVGSISNAQYSVNTYNNWNPYDKYGDNLQIQNEAYSILDFSESNPFGTY